MNLSQRIDAVCYLGDCFKKVLTHPNEKSFPGYENIFYQNPWFTEEFVKYSFEYWIKTLNQETLLKWIKNYPETKQDLSDKTVALIFAGNIPLVGLHDFICSFICGYKIIIKPSSKDTILIQWLSNLLISEFPQLEERISIESSVLKNFDIVIATGSNNSNRYFEYYFSDYPNILRKNKNSIAVLSGEETNEELENLADDIFLYFGLGCRSVSKIFLPDNYGFDKLFRAFDKYNNLINHNKYANNYDYRKALFQMNKIKYLDAGNILLVENNALNSPIGVIHYSYYNDIKQLNNTIKDKLSDIQCVISKERLSLVQQIEFGQSQKPKIYNYADQIDTINFLNSFRNDS